MDEHIAMDVAVSVANVSPRTPCPSNKRCTPHRTFTKRIASNVSMNVTQTRALLKHTVVRMLVVVVVVVMSVVVVVVMVNNY